MTQIPIDITADQAPPESIMNHLMALYQKGQLVEVVEEASQLTQEFPHTFMIWNILGAAASQIGKTTLAESALRQAMTIDSNNFDALNNLANLLSSQRKFDEAIPVYRQAICLKPDYAQAYNNLAVALSHQGRYDEALTAYKEMIILTPDDAKAYNNLAATLHNQGKLDEAISAYRQAICLKPDFAEAYHNLAITLNHQDKLDEAIPAYHQAIYLKPDVAEAYNNLAVALNSQGKFNESIEAYKQAISVKPDYAEAYHNMANALSNHDKLDEALIAYKEALSLKPDNAQAYHHLAVTLNSQGKYDEAIATFQQALTLKPDYAEAYHHLACALSYQGKYDEAIRAYKQSVMLKPDYAEAYNNLAKTLINQGKYDESITAYKQAITLKPDYAEAYNNLAISFIHKGNLDEALAAYKQAITIKPDYAEAKNDIANIMFKKGQLKEGFEFMEYRMKKKKPIVPAPRKNLIWHPQDDLQGKHFVAYEEQGLGDIIQFCRYLPLLEQRGAKVSFKVKPKLHTLLATLESQTTLMEALPAEEDVDFEAPLLSLPHLLGTTLTNIPAPTPYLYADDANIKTWSKVLSNKAFKIGICWQGLSTSKADRGRSFLLSLFTGIAQIQGVELISLHKGDGEEQLANIDFPVTTLGSNFDAGSDAFVDTAAVMTLCDLIITSDTSIAHLAGAMGCQTWVALQYDPEWRWMLNRTDSPWYPTMTLYRQRHSGDWQGVFAALEHDVRAQLNPKESFYD